MAWKLLSHAGLMRIAAKTLLLLSIAVSCGCLGTIGDAEPDDVAGSSVEACVPGPLAPSTAPLALLTPDQYQRSVRAVLADASLTLDLEPPSSDTLSELATQKLADAAAAIVARPSFAALQASICNARTATACADDFIASFSRRMFRRPATADERAWLRARFDAASADLDPNEALSVAAEIILQAPQTLYVRVDGIAADGSLRFLDGYELASRLAFFLWDAAPDDALLEAAAAGLAGEDALRAQVDRLLGDPRAREPMVKRFSAWLELDGTNLHQSLEHTHANPDRYPADSLSLRSAMRVETEALIESALFDHDGSIEWLLTTREAYINAELADLYGVPHSASDPASFVWTELPATERAGLFTRAAFLSLYANPNVPSAIKRGAFLVKHALCVPLGDPPPNADDRPVEGGGTSGVMSTREAVTTKTKDAQCAACHAVINPFGFALGTYDALGAFTTHEAIQSSDGTSHDVVIDTSVTLAGGDAGVAVDGPTALSTYLADNEGTYQCFAKRWFGNAFNRAPSRNEECALESMGADLAASRRLTDFIVALVRSDAFIMTNVAEQP